MVLTRQGAPSLPSPDLRRIMAWQSQGLELTASLPMASVRAQSNEAEARSGRGEVPEWSNGAVSKTVVLSRVPRVRIPPSPPIPHKTLILRSNIPSGHFAPVHLYKAGSGNYVSSSDLEGWHPLNGCRLSAAIVFGLSARPCRSVITVQAYHRPLGSSWIRHGTGAIRLEFPLGKRSGGTCYHALATADVR